MNLFTIPLRCLRQKWVRALALFVIFLLGVASITALYKVSTLVGEGFEQKLSSFGANIIISPHREQLTVSYGGIPMGEMNLDDGLVDVESAREAILSIALSERIAVIAPKLLGLTRYAPTGPAAAAGGTVPVAEGMKSGGFEGLVVPFVGVDFENELNLKQFWSVRGSFPGGVEAEERIDGIRLPFAAVHAHEAKPHAADRAEMVPDAAGHGAGAAAHGSLPAVAEMQPGAHGAQAALPAELDDAKTDADALRAQGFSTAPSEESLQASGFSTAPTGAADASETSGHGMESAGAAFAKAPDGTLSAVLGSRLAGRLGVQPGDVFQAGMREYYVHGVLNPTGSDDDGVMFLPLDQAQEVAALPGKASFIEVAALCSGCPIEDIVAELQEALPNLDIKALQQVVAQRMYSVNFASSLALLVALVILVSACAMVVMSMFSAVNERQKEIGLMRAVGYSRGAVFMIFSFEALCVGVLSGFAGYALGLLGAERILDAMGMGLERGGLFEWTQWLLCGAAAGLVAVLAAFFPARKAAKADPVTALGAL